jgi:CRP-like cAMP-binding protein
MKQLSSPFDPIAFFSHFVAQFGSVSAEELGAFQGAVPMRLRTFAKNEVFVAAGEKSYQFGIVIGGVFKVCYPTHDGSEHIKVFRGRHELIASPKTATLDEASDVSVISIEKGASALVFDFRDVRSFCGKNLKWQTLCSEITSRYMLENSDRIKNLMTLDAKARLKELLATSPGVMCQVPKQSIASYLRITPVHLSRLLSEKVTEP